MKTSIILIIAVLLASCNSQEGNTIQTDMQSADIGKLSGTNCYLYAGEADTVSLKLTHDGDSVSGYLDYRLKEKDKNTGTIKGKMNGNILIAEYTFFSEGVQSTRQVAFKLDGDSFFEGYGESYNQNDKAYFRNTDALNFEGSMELAEVACQ